MSTEYYSCGVLIMILLHSLGSQILGSNVT